MLPRSFVFIVGFVLMTLAVHFTALFPRLSGLNVLEQVAVELLLLFFFNSHKTALHSNTRNFHDKQLSRL